MRGVRLAGRFHARRGLGGDVLGGGRPWWRHYGRPGGRGRRPRLTGRAGAVVLAVMMPPMLAGTASSAGQAPLPSAAGVRGAVVRLADWVAGSTPSKPPVPAQREGKAPGRQHQVPAAVTRAVARARGHAPGKGAGQLPAYAFRPAKVRRFATAAAGAGGPGSFSAASSTLVPSGATATSDLYRNADGSYTRLEYLAPVNRRDAAGKWVPAGTGTGTGAGAGTGTAAGAGTAAGTTAPAPPAGSGRASGRVTLAFSGPSGAGVKGTHVTSASLRVLEAWAGQCPPAATVTVSDASGRQLGRWAGKPPASACGSGSRGGWISVPVGATGRRALDSGRNARLTLAVTPTPAISGTTGAACSGTCASVLAVTAATAAAPQVDDQWPPDGYNSPTLTPELIATGQTFDGSQPQYQFSVYDSTGTWLTASKWQTSNDWTVPAGTLTWAQTYYWTVQVFDSSGTGSPDPQAFSLSTPVPQSLVYSGFAQTGAAPAGQSAATASQSAAATTDVAGSTVPGFNPQNGNFTTKATDVSVPVVGPPLSVQRTYNSLDPLAAGAFGTGWTSVLDMKVSPGQTGGRRVGRDGGGDLSRRSAGRLRAERGRDDLYAAAGSVRDPGPDLGRLRAGRQDRRDL